MPKWIQSWILAPSTVAPSTATCEAATGVLSTFHWLSTQVQTNHYFQGLQSYFESSIPISQQFNHAD
jgi:hypothetical protein